ncbi:MAG: dehydratase [Chloroflexi bacterium]|nr:dehydratase [Chloroflexota bacterium]
MLDKTFDELQVGDRLISKGRTITEADLVLFSMLTQDWADIHTDSEFVSRTVFKKRIAHAGLTLAACCGLLRVPPDSPVEGLFGMNHIRFAAPVLVGDTIHADLEVVSKEPRDEGRGVVSLHCVIKNQRDEPVVVAPVKAMVRKERAEG